MSNLFVKPNVAEIYDRERCPMGANIVAGLLYVHCGKPLRDIHVLDAGCGTGIYTEALIKLGVGKFTLLDPTHEMLDFARRKLKDYIENKIIDDLIEAKLPCLPFQDGTFDAVMYNMVLHHLREDDQSDGECILLKALEQTLRNTKRILRPRGLLVITTPLPAIVKECCWFTQFCPEVRDDVSQYSPSTEQYLDIFAKCGFSCVAAVNFLSKATPCALKNYFDPEGPLKREWRIGTYLYRNTTDAEIAQILSDMNIKDKESLKNFMLEHDRSSEFGMMTLFVCVSV